MKEVNTDMLMRMQVEQMEKEKRELSEKLRMITKRIDHLERAYRKEERPLLAEDYEQQQTDDKRTFEELQRTRIEGARAEHAQNLETKARLARMMDDYRTRLDVVSAQRGDELAKKREKAFRKIEEEKAKRRAAVLKEREEERAKFEEEERIAREEEERIAREEEGESSYLCASRSSLIASFRASCGGGASPGRGGAARSGGRGEEACRGGDPRCCPKAAGGGACRRCGGCSSAARARGGGCRSSCWWAQNAPATGGSHARPRISIG
jgi:hypothetical protein